MKRTVFLIMLGFLFFNITNANSQIKKISGQWSLYVGGNIFTNLGVSNEMQGTLNRTEEQFMMYGDYAEFPFGDKNTTSIKGEITLFYRLPDKKYSFFISNQAVMFSVNNGIKPFFSYYEKEATLHILSFLPGIEYSFGNENDLLNYFGKFGIGFNLISGSVRYIDDYADVIPEFRMGFQAETGGRLNIPYTPVSIELSVGYTNANLIGKSREENQYAAYEIYLNDSSNDEFDSKTIDFLSANIGLKFWF